tara:strand:+ start:988 stop:2553 length:1566 start_codon:yes stop_codon:yes gene_type:complete
MDKLKQQIEEAVNIFKSGNLPKAEEISRSLIKSNPKVAFLYNLIGLILSQSGKTDEAIKYYEKGLEIDPKFAMIYNNLGLIFYNKGPNNYKKAEDYYKKSIETNKDIPEPHTNLGNLYSTLGKINEAISNHKKAIKLNPNFQYAYLNLSNILVSIGDFKEAKKYLNEVIKINSNFYVAHRSLSRINKYTKDDEHLKILKKLYKNISSSDEDGKMNVAFALGKACEDIKDFDKSFFYYSNANSFFRKKINFSIKEEENKFQDIKDIYDKDLFNKFKESGYKDSKPIFIVGMPRSGTTLIEQIISSHSEVFGADEIEFIPNLLKKYFKNHDLRLFFSDETITNQDQLKKIGSEYQENIKIISNNSNRSTDKLPNNFQSIGFIKLILPNSKIIHCNRNPKDTIFSIFKHHFPGGKINFAYNLDETVQYYNLYNDLMKYWNKLFPEFIYNIDYEKLISNSENEIRKLINFCDLKWEEDCLNYHNNKRLIRTASNTQARMKIYNTSINNWKNYENSLSKFFSNIKN